MTQIKSRPLVTVIVAVFNGVTTLQQCIDSITKQTYPNKELIVIDNASKDGTLDLLQANGEQIDYYISEQDCGIYNAWNKGLARATGEWICFLGADDFFWDSQVLEQISAHLVTIPPSIRVAYSKIMLLNSAGECLYTIGEPWEKLAMRFNQFMCIPHPGLLHRRSLFEKHGNFNETFRIAGDYELLLRELKSSDAVFIPDVIMTGMRRGGISSDLKNSLTVLREIRLAQSIHGSKIPGTIRILATIKAYIWIILAYLLGERLAEQAQDFGRRLLK
jgi:glycosyltransferase involved in cell wall biosynthesis